MGHKGHLMKKFDNPISRQICYSKRRERILKKAAMLCDTDVGLLMFSPTGRLTTYANKGRVEDIFLRYISQPDDFKGPVENKEFLYQSLKYLKYEGEMLDKLESIEALERELSELNRKRYDAQNKMRSYNPDVTNILSTSEANLHQEVVMDAIQRIEKLKNAKLLEEETLRSKPNDVEMPAVEVDSNLKNEETAKGKRIETADYGNEEAELPAGPHLSISYLLIQRNWYTGNAEDKTSGEGQMS